MRVTAKLAVHCAINVMEIDLEKGIELRNVMGE
jgi:hypothetical protein